MPLRRIIIIVALFSLFCACVSTGNSQDVPPDESLGDGISQEDQNEDSSGSSQSSDQDSDEGAKDLKEEGQDNSQSENTSGNSNQQDEEFDGTQNDDNDPGENNESTNHDDETPDVSCDTPQSCRWQDFKTWLLDSGFSTFATIIASDYENGPKKAHIDQQLAVNSSFLSYMRDQSSPVIQLVDVLALDQGWSNEPLQVADIAFLENEFLRTTGKAVQIVHVTEYVTYETVFAGKFSTLPNHDIVVCSSYQSVAIDPDIPVIYTFGVERDDANRLVIASCSGGLRDQSAHIGSTSRPITSANSSIYIHEFLHSLGILHHYANDLYTSALNRQLGAQYLYGTDCLMSDGYVASGLKYADHISDRDFENRLRMRHHICPLCRYLINPDHDVLSYQASYDSLWDDRLDPATGDLRQDLSLNLSGSQNVIVGQQLQLQASASQGSGTYFFKLYGAPSGLSVNDQSGLLSWVPNLSQVGSHDLTLIVYDGVLAQSLPFTVTVQP